ncbi:MAG: acyltransferase domain-containing protein, partial [Myxococcales bacterium]|nr:acyltransferase domain-containing protein [Myxococcales bacterium]
MNTPPVAAAPVDRPSSPASEASLQAWLVAQIAALTGVAPDRVDPRASFHENGLSSALAVELVAALGAELGRPLSPTIVWQFPTAIALARWLAGVSPSTDEARPGEPGRGDAPATRAEPVAVIGIGCRFPGGADTPDRFWELLRRGVDAVTLVPKDRWDGEAYFDADLAAPGKMNTRRGGFLDRVDAFDPLFFGISPREAVDMDPQQRLALELAWEALEDAGVVPSSIRETPAGVFLGAIFGDYERLLLRRGAGGATPHTSTGSARGILANRISYALGLQGPSLVVDTACSSSLVAVHLACHSIQRGESTLALAGGVQLNLDPDTGVEMCKFGALSPDGRCATFDARANGYVRGEGGAVVVLKPLSAALRDGDRVYGVLLGSAVNNDGPSNGLTAPNPEAQRKVLAEACRSAAIAPASVGYVELHGTGTVLGDPCEAGALGSVYGAGRPPDRPLLVGSVKTNLGHLEGAAGIAGLVKTLLALHHRALPPSLHFERPNPYIDFAASRLAVVTAYRPWPGTDGAAPRAGVSAFGFGGTNAHVIVEGRAEAASIELVPISGSDEASLRGRVAEVRAALAGSCEQSPDDPVTQAPGWFADADEHRIAVLAARRAELDEALGRWQAGIPDRRVFAGRRPPEPLRPVFVFAGFGSQWFGMGRKLHAEEPVFRASLARCDASLRADYGWSLLDELWAAPGRQRLEDPDESDVLFPVLVALQIALADLFRSWGVEPAAVIGQSIGEVAAAHVAGILDTRDAMRVVAELGKAHRASWHAGGFLLALTTASPATIGDVLRPFAGRAYLAGHLAPAATTVSGEATAVQEILQQLRGRGFRCRELAHVVSHCPLAAPYAAAMTAPLQTIAPARARIPMISTTSGLAVEGAELTAAYWRANLESPVLLSPGVASLARAGHRHFIELGPHAILLPFLEATLTGQGDEPAIVLASQLRDADGRAAALRALGRLFTLGAPVRWPAVSPVADTPAPLLLPLSARSEEALRMSAGRHRDLLRARPTRSRDLCFSATFHREHHDLRLAVAARSRDELADKLDAFAGGELLEGVTSARRSPRAGRAVFVFPGQGSQWLGMGREMASEPVFRDALSRCDAAIRAHAGFSLLDLLFAANDTRALEPVDVVQPALFAMQVAISELWRSWGIEPAVVVGHSMGEIAAAHVAGALSLDDAARIICARSRLVRERNPGNGGMALVELSLSEAEAAIASHASLAVAAINGPRGVVLSGDRDALSAVLADLSRQRVWVRSINVDYASHSPQMDALAGPLRELLRGVRATPASIPFFSTVTARRED